MSAADGASAVPSNDAPGTKPRPVVRSLARGFAMRCPRCGRGRLFSGFLRSADHCADCGEAFHHQRADDLPPYLTVFVVGHLVVAMFMAVEQVATLSLAAHMAIWLPLTLVLSLALLRPFKGATIGLQWALRMHGFADERDTTTSVQP